MDFEPGQLQQMRSTRTTEAAQTRRGLTPVSKPAASSVARAEAVAAESAPRACRKGMILPELSDASLKEIDSHAHELRKAGVPSGTRISASRLPTLSRGFSAREIIGPTDDRTRITNVTSIPFSMMCELESDLDGTNYLRGSGWLAGPHLVVTAAHCVFNRNASWGPFGWVQRVTVYPGGKNSGLGSQVVTAKMHTTQEWIDFGDQANDFGGLILDQAVDQYFAFANFDANTLSNMLVNIAGFPGDKPPGQLWGHANRIVEVFAQVLGYYNDTKEGQSGSAVLCWDDSLPDDSKATVVGIHNAGSTQENFAVRINADVFNTIKGWKSLT